MTARRVSALAAIAAAVLTTSCSETAGGNPGTPTSLAQSSSAGSAPSSTNPNVPKVKNPLDVSALKADPCNALSPQQAQQLGLKPGNTESSQSGPNCEFDYANVVGNRVTFSITEEFDAGLADIYKRKEALGYFEATTVAGHPAVYAGKYDDRDKGRCMLHVGLTNDFAITIFALLNGGTDKSRPCDVTKMTAEAMIKHLKGGA